MVWSGTYYNVLASMYNTPGVVKESTVKLLLSLLKLACNVIMISVSVQTQVSGTSKSKPARMCISPPG